MSEPKKTLSELSREELIEKCKHFLQLAQKAKTAKDGEIILTKTLKVKVGYSLTAVAQTTKMTSAKLAHFLSEEKNLHIKNKLAYETSLAQTTTLT